MTGELPRIRRARAWRAALTLLPLALLCSGCLLYDECPADLEGRSTEMEDALIEDATGTTVGRVQLHLSEHRNGPGPDREIFLRLLGPAPGLGKGPLAGRVSALVLLDERGEPWRELAVSDWEHPYPDDVFAATDQTGVLDAAAFERLRRQALVGGVRLRLVTDSLAPPLRDVTFARARSTGWYEPPCTT